MAETRLSAEPRNEKTTPRALRRMGKVPGVFYNRDGVNRKLQFDAHELELLVRKEFAILNVDFAGETLQCLIREVQRHPVRRSVLHIDLMGFVAGQKVKAHVPVHAVGIAAGTKEGGLLEVVLRELEIECLPADMPSHIDIDVTDLNLHMARRIEDIKIPGVTVHGDPHAAVIHVVPLRQQAEPVPGAAVATTAEPEVIREKKPAAEAAAKDDKDKDKKKK